MYFSNVELLLRLVLSTVVGGVIGYERELKGRDAGIRTHTLVSIGAAIVTMSQLLTSEWLLNFTIQNPALSNVLTSDITRLTAQVVNGIGFLGAGTIIVSKKSVSGLTTAASIWAVAGLGIAAGMGYYFLTISSTFIILFVLSVVKKLFKIDRTKLIEIKYLFNEETSENIDLFFEQHNVTVLSDEFSIVYEEENKPTFKSIYILHLSNNINFKKLIFELGKDENILSISTIKQI